MDKSATAQLAEINLAIDGLLFSSVSEKLPPDARDQYRAALDDAIRRIMDARDILFAHSATG